MIFLKLSNTIFLTKLLSQPNPWSIDKDACKKTFEKLESIKQEIKQEILSNPQSNMCCYCLTSFLGVYKMSIDIEHILPKSIFKHCTFLPTNLGIACKRCNMKIKKDDISFLDDAILQNAHIKTHLATTKKKRKPLTIIQYSSLRSELNKSSSYKIIHPNFDEIDDHIDLIHHQSNKFFIRKFIPKTPKGDFSYKYFKLSETEANYLDKAQEIISTPNQATAIRDLVYKKVDDFINEIPNTI